jgi:hypothetical protein
MKGASTYWRTGAICPKDEVTHYQGVSSTPQGPGDRRARFIVRTGCLGQTEARWASSNGVGQGKKREKSVDTWLPKEREFWSPAWCGWWSPEWCLESQGSLDLPAQVVNQCAGAFITLVGTVTQVSAVVVVLVGQRLGVPAHRHPVPGTGWGKDRSQDTAVLRRPVLWVVHFPGVTLHTASN